MAAQLKLVKREDLATSDDSTLNLYANASGYSLARGGWVAKVASDADDRIIETIPLMVFGSSHDDLASKVQAIEAYLLQAPYYWSDPTERTAIWLRDQLTNETNARQAMVEDAAMELTSALHSPPADPGNYIRNYILALKRMPFWEEVAYTSYDNASGSVEVTGGAHDYTGLGAGDVVGDVPARVGYFTVEATTGGPLYEFWAGFRTDRMGTPGSFQPLWELEDGTMGTDASSDVVSGASGGSAVTVSPGTETMATRVTISVYDAVTTPATDVQHQRGSYIVLLRASVDSGSTYRVRMGSGQQYGSDWQTRTRVEISSASWLLYELGRFDIPSLYKQFYTYQYWGRSAIRLEAERTGGSGDLYLDCLVLIPYTEGALYGLAGTTSGTIDKIATWTHANGMLSGHADSSTGNTLCNVTLAPFGPWGWTMPTGDGRIIFAAQRETSHVLADRLGYSFSVYQRWRTLRGSED